MKKSGFTLIELTIAVAIIGLLASVIAPNALQAIEKAKVAKAVKDSQSITKAAMAFRADVGLWPGSQWGVMPADPLSEAQYGEGFCSPPAVHSGTAPQQAVAANAIQHWDGPYLENWVYTPWGMPYMWDYNNWDATGNGRFPEYIVWFDLAHSPGPYDTNNKVPQSARERLDYIVDSGDGFTTNTIQLMDSGFYGDSIMALVYEGT